MGQRQSATPRRDRRDESEPGVEIIQHNGVRLTPALASRLALEQATRGAGGGAAPAGRATLAPSDFLPPSTPQTIRAAEAISSHVDRDVRVAAEKMIAKSASLSKALETSHLVNDLLVAREEEELVKIDRLSREVLEREGEKYGVDLEREEGEKRCGREEALVAGCYREHAGGAGGDPRGELVCRGLVDAYVRCAYASSDIPGGS